MPLVRHLTAFRLHSPHTHRAEVKQFIELTAHATRDGYINRLKLLRGFDVRDRLHDIRQPALFLASEHDHLVPAVVQARYMADRVPSSVMRILKGHGHICLIAPTSIWRRSSMSGKRDRIVDEMVRSNGFVPLSSPGLFGERHIQRRRPSLTHLNLCRESLVAGAITSMRCDPTASWITNSPARELFHRAPSMVTSALAGWTCSVSVP